MKLTTTTQMTLDGVVQGNGGASENRSGGFERGGWARPGSDPACGAFIGEVYQRADAFLFGRRTYDLFAGYWGTMQGSDNPIASALNARPKYVASTTLDEATWDGTTVVSGDLEVAIRDLKAQAGGELQVHGSGTLVRWLLEHDLVDEMNVLLFPVVVGQGMRLFPENGPDLRLDLLDSRTFPTGITLQVYRPDGRPEYRA